MTMRGKKRATGKILGSESAFTLLEVIIAVSILTIGLLAVAKMQIVAIKGNYFSDNTTIALNLAEKQMERLLGLAWTHADLSDAVPGNNNDLTSVVNFDHEQLNVDERGVVGTGPFRRVWNIADSTPITNNKTVCVIVTWGLNNRHRVALTSIKPI
jgi:type IV pilus assembly protein PilV